MIIFIVSTIAFLLGAAVGGHIMGRTAYDDEDFPDSQIDGILFFPEFKKVINEKGGVK